MKRRVSSFALALLLAAPLRMPAQTASTPEAGGGYVNFNFEQVDLRLLVRLVGEMTGRRFVVDEGVDGKVTVITPQRIPASEAYPLLVSILESTGFTVLEKGDTYQIVRLADRGIAGAPVVTETDAAGAVGLITKVIRVENVSVVELRKLLEPLVRGGKNGAISAFPPTNHLIITDTAENIRQMERIIGELDKPGASRVVDVVQLKHTSADELARQLVAAMRGSDTAGDKVARHLQQVGDGYGSLPSDVIVVPASHANSLVIVGTPVQLKEIREVIAKMDVEAPSGYGRLNAIFLKYLSAEEAAKNLNALLAKTTDKDQHAAISLEHNIANNALIVDASPQDFEYLKQLVDKLDQIPQQVLVEVLIAEVSVGKNLDLGVRLSSAEQPKDGKTTFIGNSRMSDTDPLVDAIEKGVFPQGIAVGVANGTFTDSAGRILPSVPILIRALEQNKDVKILSKMPLWAQNNIEATVSVVENIPILRSTIEGGTGSSRDVIQNIDRIDVGIKLKVTPHVNPDGEIMMQLNPTIEAIVDQGSSETQFTPTIAKREVSTTVTVPNEATIVISGLVREDRIKSVSGVPFLSRIPLIGWLFRSKSEQVERTNLLIFVTPHIVTDMKKAMALKKSLEEATHIQSQPEQEKKKIRAGKE